jgi:WD40 repeat protein
MRRRPLCLGAFLILLAASTCQGAAPPTPRLDRNGYPLPTGAVARLGQLRFRHMSPVSALAFSPDGAVLATGGENLRPHLWDVATARPLPSPSVKHGAHALAFSPAGKLLAWGGNGGEIYLWDAVTGKMVRVLPRHQSFITALAFSPDGKRLASGGSFEDFTVRVWEVKTGRELFALRGHTLSITALAFSPNGKLLASAGLDGDVRLWSTATGRPAHHLRANKEAIFSISFSSDGKWLATGGRADEAVRLWSPATGKEVGRLPGHGFGVAAVAFAPRGRLLATIDQRQTLRLWDVEAGKLVRSPRTVVNYSSRALAWSPDGKRLAWFDNYSNLRVWDTTGPLVRAGHTDTVFCLAFSPDGKALASVGGPSDVGGAKDGGTLLWDTATWRERRLGKTAPAFPRVAFRAADGALVLANRERVAWWETATDRALREEQLEESEGAPLAFSADGATMVCAGLSFHQAGARPWRPPGPRRSMNVAAFSPDGKALAVGGRLYYRDGMLASPSRALPILLLDVKTGRELSRFVGLEGSINALAFSPAGEWLASASGDGTVRVWSVRTRREHLRLEGHSAPLAFSPDGRALACLGPDDSVRLYELASGEERLRFQGHQGPVRCLAFSPDGKALATGSEDTTILVWGLRPVPARLRHLGHERLWALLAADASTAGLAVQALAEDERSVPFLRGRLAPAKIDSARIARAIADLGSDEFTAREGAMKALATAGEAALPALRRALAARPSLEVRLRLEGLLERAEKGALSREQVRELRAVEALEQAGTPQARRLLEALAGGDADARLTREAKAALRRVGASRAEGGD